MQEVPAGYSFHQLEMEKEGWMRGHTAGRVGLPWPSVRPSMTLSHTRTAGHSTQKLAAAAGRERGGAATSKYLIQQLLLLSRVPQGAAQVEVVFALLLLRGVKQVRPKSVSNDNLFQAVFLSFHYSSSACCC